MSRGEIPGFLIKFMDGFAEFREKVSPLLREQIEEWLKDSSVEAIWVMLVLAAGVAEVASEKLDHTFLRHVVRYFDNLMRLQRGRELFNDESSFNKMDIM